jgi:hypothetical protein
MLQELEADAEIYRESKDKGTTGETFWLPI